VKSELLAVVIICAAANPLPAQTAWKTPKTPWGDPDLQGVWPSSSMLMTPLERDPKLGARNVLTDQEYRVKAMMSKVIKNGLEGATPSPRVNIGAGWADYGVPDRQASLVIDPPDGRIPPLTPEAQQREALRLSHYKVKHNAPDTWEDLTMWERCISLGVVGSVLPLVYNHGNQIVQSPGYVVFRNEMVHEARIIPVNGAKHIAPAIRQYMGDSIGHWEGSTLVVETTNFNGKAVIGMGGGFEGAGTLPTESLQITERFNRTDERTIAYRATIEDPNTWTKPWTIEFPLRKDDSYNTLYEYACHEGNIFMYDVLSGARAQEKPDEGAAAK
jgi:hypothetical protein